MQKGIDRNSDPTQLHPYEYLRELNSIYSSCNKANARSFSSVSKMKLAWKPFSIMKIPNCFQVTYESWQKNDKQNKMQAGPTMEDNQKRIWKEHQEIMKRYLKDKQNNTYKLRPRTGMAKSKSNFNTQKENQACLAGQQPNLLIKRMMEKGVKLSYNRQDVKEEVIKKLQKIQSETKKKNGWRAQSAITHEKINSEIKSQYERVKTKGQFSLLSNDDPFFENKKLQLEKLKSVDEKEYLDYNRNSEIIADYKKKIKQVDCAISDYNVKKTAFLLRNMQNIVKNLQ